MKGTLYKFIMGTGGVTSPGYNEFAWRLSWIVACVCVVTYASFLYFGGISSAYDENEDVLVVQDLLLKPGEHHLSGAVKVPSSCHEVDLRIDEALEHSYVLTFTTWQEPSRVCTSHEQTRPFNTVVFAPSFGTTFSATLDGKELPLRVEKRR